MDLIYHITESGEIKLEFEKQEEKKESIVEEFSGDQDSTMKLPESFDEQKDPSGQFSAEEIEGEKDPSDRFPVVEFTIQRTLAQEGEYWFGKIMGWIHKYADIDWLLEMLSKLGPAGAMAVFFIKELGLDLVMKEYVRVLEDWIWSGFDMVKSKYEEFKSQIYKTLTSPIKPKDYQEKHTQLRYKEEVVMVEQPPPSEEIEIPWDDVLDQRFNKLVRFLGDYFSADIQFEESEYPVSLVPGEYFRENGWICIFRFPRAFFDWFDLEKNTDLFSSASFLNLEPSFYGFDSKKQLLGSLLLTFSVRSITIPERTISFDSFKAGHPILLTLPSRIAEEDFGSLSCEFWEISSWKLADFERLEVFPAYVFFKSYLDWASGLPESVIELPPLERHRRLPLPALDASILISLYIFEPRKAVFSGDIDFTVREGEEKKILENSWIFKILALPTKVHLNTELRYVSGNPIISRVDFNVLFSHSFKVNLSPQVGT